MGVKTFLMRRDPINSARENPHWRRIESEQHHAVKVVKVHTLARLAQAWDGIDPTMHDKITKIQRLRDEVEDLDIYSGMSKRDRAECQGKIDQLKEAVSDLYDHADSIKDHTFAGLHRDRFNLTLTKARQMDQRLHHSLVGSGPSTAWRKTFGSNGKYSKKSGLIQATEDQTGWVTLSTDETAGDGMQQSEFKNKAPLNLGKIRVDKLEDYIRQYNDQNKHVAGFKRIKYKKNGSGNGGMIECHTESRKHDFIKFALAKSKEDEKTNHLTSTHRNHQQPVDMGESIARSLGARGA